MDVSVCNRMSLIQQVPKLASHSTTHVAPCTRYLTEIRPQVNIHSTPWYHIFQTVTALLHQLTKNDCLLRITMYPEMVSPIIVEVSSYYCYALGRSCFLFISSLTLQVSITLHPISHRKPPVTAQSVFH